MTVTNRIEVGKKVCFKDLEIGEAYYDKEGFLCIKTDEPNWDDVSYGSCLAYVNDEWRAEEEHETSEVTPLRVEMVVLGYK